MYAKTPEEIRKIWDHTGKTEEESKRDDLFKEIFLWWWDSYMEVMATPEYWSKAIRCTKLFTDTHTMREPRKEIKDHHCSTEIFEKHFAKKMYITITMEAFALWSLENCHDKWVAEFKFRATHPHSQSHPLPNTAEFQALYTDSKCGQKEFGGWKPAGLQRWNELATQTHEFRHSNKVKSGEYPKLVKKLLREAHVLEDNEELPQKGRGKKRKIAVPAVKLVHFD